MSNANLSVLQQIQVLNTYSHVSTSNLTLNIYKQIHDYCSDVEYTVLLYLFMILFGNTISTVNTVISAGSKYLPCYLCTFNLYLDDSQRLISSWKISKYHYVNWEGTALSGWEASDLTAKPPPHKNPPKQRKELP